MPANATCATQFTSVPIPTGADAHFLTGVATVGGSAWAVGRDSTSLSSVVIHWNGSSWVTNAVPVIANERASLLGVGGTSNGDVWAAGYVDGRSAPASAPRSTPDPTRVEDSLRSAASRTVYPLALHRDGTSWSSVPAPTSLQTRGGVLLDTGSTSSTDAWLVGTSWRHYGHAHTLIEHWNGVALTRIPSPNVGTRFNWLSSVTGIAANDAWAVGWRGRLNGVKHALVEHWDGSIWSVVPVGLRQRVLTSVSASSPSDVWAVGGPFPGSTHRLPLAIHWDGVSWTSEPLPSLPPNTSLWGVSAPSFGDAYAVGAGFDPTTASRSASVLHWNGADWTEQTEAGGSSEFDGVAAGPSGVWAVGSTWLDPVNDPYDITALIETPCP
jgi:hypothetical protein